MPESATQIHTIIYGSVLGAGLIADIAFPVDGNVDRLPAIVSIHGGRWIRGTRFDDGLDGRPDNGVVNIKQWAQDGFFVMRIDYRLVACTPAPACFQDVACAIRWLHANATTYRIDTNRIFLLGQSCGGHLVSLGATLGFDAFERTGGWESYAPDFTAGISVSGAYDLLTLDWGSGWCPPGIAWDRAREFASPIQHATRDSKPLLLVHAEGDVSVPIEQADAFAQKLQASGTRFEYKRFGTGGHLKFNPSVVEVSKAFIGQFLSRH